MLGLEPVLIRLKEAGRGFVTGVGVSLSMGGLNLAEVAEFLFSFRRIVSGPEEVALSVGPFEAGGGLGLPGRPAGLFARGGIAKVGIARLSGGSLGGRGQVEVARSCFHGRGPADNAV